MLFVFRLVYTRIFIDNYPTTLLYHKHAKVRLYEYKEEGSGSGFNQKKDLTETDSQFIIKFDMF